MMKYLICLVLLLPSLLITGKLFTQEVDFEIDIADDSLSIAAHFFTRAIDEGYVGVVLKAPLYDELKYYTSYVYSISENGDTSSVCFAKEDSVVIYGNFIRIEKGEPGYLLSGITASLESTDDLYNIFTRLDADMNILWEKIYRFNFFYSGWSMRALQLHDSSFIYCCSPRTSVDMFLLKLSYYGDSLAYRAYAGDSAGSIQSITYNPDTTAIWLHNNWAHYSGFGLAVNSCIEIDATLNQVEVFHYPEFYTSLPFSSKLLPNGKLISCGSSKVFVPPDYQEVNRFISVYTLDSAFNIIYSKHLTNPDTLSRAGETKSVDYYYPNCIYVAGTHNLQGITGHDPSWYYVAKLNDTLGLEYEKYIGGEDYYWLSSMAAGSDGGVLLTGFRTEVNGEPFHHDAYIIKLDSAGCITNVLDNTGIVVKDALVYPNPGRNIFNIRTALKDCTIQLFDLRGRMVTEQSINNLITTINTSILNPGTYVYVLSKDNKTIETGKWIKQY